MDMPDIFKLPAKTTLESAAWLLQAEYPRCLLDDIVASVQRQDPQAIVLGISFEAEPRVETSVARSGVITSQTVTFSTQILIQAGTGHYWRHFVFFTYQAQGLASGVAQITFAGDVKKSEELQG